MKLLESVTQYVVYKQSVGQSFTTDEIILKAFCRHVGHISLQSITKEQVQHYLKGKRPITSFWTRKHTALAGMFRFAVSRGHLTISPLPAQQPQMPPSLVPYIYSRNELKRLLEATQHAAVNM